jgi:putative serine protease PepD
VPDEADDDDASGGPPHPLDRVWFHPSELSGYMAATPTRRGGLEWSLAGVAALLGAVVTVLVLALAGGLDGDTPRLTSSHLTAVGGSGGDVANVVELAAPSILAVRVLTPLGAATGSGVALGRTQVLTSATLLAGAAPDAVTVSTSDGRVLDATIAGTDADTDLALLMVKTRHGAHLTPARLAATDPLVVGQAVVALGIAGGDHKWTGTGVINALDRLVSTSTGAELPGLMETDVQPGDSVGGGALLDASGAVIGILVRSAPGTALPIDVARDIADQLATSGRAHHGWLGVDTVDAGDRPGGGARVTAVVAGGPADAAGIAVGDVIVVVGTDRVSDTPDLMAAVARRRPGDPVGITLWRSSKRVHRDVDLGERTVD